MPDRWTITPSGRAVRSPEPRSGLATSIVSGAFVFLLFAVVLLIAVAVLLPDRSGGISTAGVAASPAPSGGPGSGAPPAAARSASPGPSVLPSTSAPPLRTIASPAPAASPASTTLRRPAPLVLDGRRVGRVTVQAVRGVPARGLDLPDDRRVVAAVVRLVAVARLRFDATDWQLEDEDGRRWPAMSEPPGAPVEAFGQGSLQPRQSRVASVAFVVPTGTAWRKVILTDGAGEDLLVVTRPGAGD